MSLYAPCFFFRDGLRSISAGFGPKSLARQELVQTSVEKKRADGISLAYPSLDAYILGTSPGTHSDACGRIDE